MAAEHGGLYLMFLAPPLSKVSGSPTDTVYILCCICIALGVKKHSPPPSPTPILRPKFSSLMQLRMCDVDKILLAPPPPPPHTHTKSWIRTWNCDFISKVATFYITDYILRPVHTERLRLRFSV